MKSIELFGQVDERHRLSADVPLDIPPGTVRLSILVPSQPLTEADAESAQWARGVAKEWAEELSDTREDIYTLADGEPVDAGR